MAHLSKFSRTSARFGNGQYAVSMQGLRRPAVLDIFAIVPLVGRILYFGMLRPPRPYVPRKLVSLVIYHGGNIELNPV